MILIGLACLLLIALGIAVCFFAFGGDRAAKGDTPSGTMYTVTFDGNGVAADNLPGQQKVAAGEKVTEPGAPNHENYYFVGWHTSAEAVAFVDTPVDFEEYLVEEDVTLYAIWEAKSIDFDADGLDYQQEEQYGTDAFLLDTDADGLSDGDEVLVHKTDPLKADSDGDGILDGVEISLELNPLSTKSDNTTEDIQRQVQAQIQDDHQLFDLKVSATPDMLSTIITETFPLSSLEDSEGLISPIIQVEYDKNTTFTSAELTFDYSKVDLAGISEDELTFLYLNEETGMYEVVSSTVNKQAKTITCQPTHFSMYVVGGLFVSNKAIALAESFRTEYLGNPMKVVTTTNFDVKQHAFALPNFQYEYNGGFCYGFAFVAYLNYMEKLPVKQEGYSDWRYTVPGYDLSAASSDDIRFYQNQLYIENEKNFFAAYKKKNYTLSIDRWSPTLKCIANWFAKQSSLRNQVFDNLAYKDNFQILKNKLMNDEPVVLALWIPFVKGHVLLAYGLYQSPVSPNVYYISVYDSNYPGQLRYIKATRSGDLSQTYMLEYDDYMNFQLANFDIPEGPYVPHRFDVSGTVVSDAKAVAGAKITITNETYSASVMADDKGVFRIAEVPNGVYNVEISAKGYVTGKMENALTVYGQEVDLGNLELEKASPKLTQVNVEGSDGNLIEQIQYTYEGERLTGIYDQYFLYESRYNSVLTYDEAGILRLMSCENPHDGSGAKYEFDSAGRLTSESVWEGDGYTIDYEYDAQGKLIRGYQSELGDTTITEYHYNAEGVLVSATETTTSEYADDTAITTYAYTYDLQGRLQEIYSESKTYGFSSITTYSYGYSPFVLSVYESLGQYGYRATELILQNENGFELGSVYFSNPTIYLDASGNVAKVVDVDSWAGTEETYVFYYDGVAAEAVGEAVIRGT